MATKLSEEINHKLSLTNQKKTPPSLKAVKGLKDRSSKVSKPRRFTRMTLNPKAPNYPTKKKREACYDEQTRRCAEKAMEFYNAQLRGPGEPEYVLVNPVRSTATLTAMGVYFHANFEAIVVNDPEAPVELFFAELLQYRPMELSVEQVSKLGPSKSKPAALGIKGCSFCHTGFIHPKDWKEESDDLDDMEESDSSSDLDDMEESDSDSD